MKKLYPCRHVDRITTVRPNFFSFKPLGFALFFLFLGFSQAHAQGSGTTPTVSIGNFVWKDTNQNGTHEAGETGISGVTITLTDPATGTTVSTTTTNTSGEYYFYGLTPSKNYVISLNTTQTVLAKCDLTLSNIGMDDAKDSDAILTGTTAAITARSPATGTDFSFAFGFKPKAPDLEITKTVTTPTTKVINGNSTPTAKPGEVVTWVISLANKGVGDATGVEISTDVLVGGVFSSVNASPSVGTYTAATGKWVFTNSISPNSSASLTITATVASSFVGGVANCKSYVSKENEIDLNTALSTDPTKSDSVATACFTVPLKLCVGENLSLTANVSSGSSIQWFRDGVAVAAASTNPVLAITQAGNYTFQYTSTTGGVSCPAGSCCPICVEGCIDLALDKKLATGQATSVRPSDDVKFTITVYNQGNVSVKNTKISDYLPADMTFDATKNPGWSNIAGVIGTTIASTLTAGSSTTVDIILTVKPTFTGTKITNNTEVSEMQDLTGTIRPDDVDSTPDSSPSNDGTPKDDVINEKRKQPNGTNDNTKDEDDADFAEITVIPCPTVAAFSPSIVCAGQSIALSASPAPPAPVAGTYTYAWAGSNNFSSTAQNPTVAIPANATASIYSYTVTLNNGGACVATASTTVAVNPLPTPTATGGTICAGGSLTLQATGLGSYTWAGPTNFNSTLQNPQITSAATSNAGVYTVTVSTPQNCTAMAITTVVVNPLPTPLASGSDVCAGQTVGLTASGGVTYAWAGQNSFSSTSSTPSIPNATIAAKGVYTVTVSTSNSCSATATTSVNIRPLPVSSAGGQSVCEGESLSITASGGTTYAWNGPNGYTSSNQNITRSPATTDMAGNYTVTVTLDNCTATASTTAQVRPLPKPTLTGMGVCAGNSLSVSASGGTTYAWAGPSNFSSTVQNPTISSAATTAMSGVYSVTVTQNSCSVTGTVTGIVRPLPTPTASNNGPVCVNNGQILELNATGGVSYAWAGPATFSSQLKSPTRAPITSNMAGVYTVTVTDSNSCTNTATTDVKVNIPTGGLTGKSILCSGETLILDASGGGDYRWAGPNNFTSVQASISITNATTLNAGVYTVSITNLSGCTISFSTSVQVNTATITVDSNSPVCVGSMLSITATGGGSYAWAGPGNFTATTATLSRPSVGASMAGVYSVTATATNSCTASTTLSVVVNTQGANITTNTPVCVGEVLDLNASSGGSGYVWAGPNNFSATTQNPAINNVTSAAQGVYTVTITGSNNCAGTTTSSVKINAKPIPTASNSASALADGLCAGLDINLSATGGTSYVWVGPNSFSSTLQNPSITSASTVATGVYSVTVRNADGCSATATTSLSVKNCYGSIGDYVWKDLNYDGIQDATEQGVKNVRVELYKTDAAGTPIGSPIQIEMTDTNGKYLFDSLATGNYKVKFDLGSLPPNCYFTKQDQGTDDTKDSDVNPTDGFTPIVKIDVTKTGIDKENPTIDAGLYTPYGSIGNYVWKDNNSNGIQETGEKGVKGVKVELYKTDASGNIIGSAIKTKITDAGGAYLFDSLLSGSYKVKFDFATIPANCVPTRQKAGTDPTIDSNPDPTTGWTDVVTLDVTKTGIDKDNPTIDAGLYYPLGSIGDYVWKDTNASGIQDVGEKGVPNIMVELYKTNAQGVIPTGALPYKSRMTDANGKYLFDSLPSGDYKVKFVLFSLPADCSLTDPAKGTDNTKDSDADKTTGLSPKITIDALGTGKTKDNPDIDAGLVQNYGSIGDYVWKDGNRNGIQDTGEKGVKDVTVELYTVNSQGQVSAAPIKVRKTDADGKYLFDSLPTATYRVKFVSSSFPADCSPTKKSQGTDPTKDSDADPTTGFTADIPIKANGTGTEKNNPTIDAGLVPEYGSLGDFVWKDTNANGIQESGEPGVPNVVIELYKADTQGNLIPLVVKTTKTNAQGGYTFDSLATGSYIVKFVTSSFPADCNKLTSKDKGTDDAKDSDADPTSGLSPVIAINTKGTGLAKDNPTIDAGLVPTFGSLGDYVWKDRNGNGIQDNTEKGVADVKIELYKTDASGTPQATPFKTTVTDINGKYLFDSLPKGDYKVKFITATLPADCNKLTSLNKGTDPTKDSDADPTTGFSPKVSIDPNGTGLAKNNPTIDAGIVPILGSIGDYVWKDENTDGIQDGIEKGVKDVMVELYSANASGVPLGAPIATTKTDTDGKYLFDSLDKGTYVVKFLTTGLPADCNKLTDAERGTDKGKDSDPDPTTGLTKVIDIQPADPTKKDIRTVDAGLVNPSPSTACKLDAGSDQKICAPQSTAALKAATGSQFWSFLSGPSVATVSGTGAVAGMTKRGVYRFVLSEPNGTQICKDTVAIKRGILEFPDPSTCAETITLTAASAGQNWAIVTGNPAAASISQAGVVSGMTILGTYKFVLNTSTCKDTVMVTRTEGPIFQALATAVTCNDATPNANGKLTVVGAPAGAKADYSVGSTYTGTKTAATASTIPADGVIANNLLNPSGTNQAYTIRVWDNEGGCYTDKQVMLIRTDCSCPPPKCVPFEMQVIKR